MKRMEQCSKTPTNEGGLPDDGLATTVGCASTAEVTRRSDSVIDANRLRMTPTSGGMGASAETPNAGVERIGASHSTGGCRNRT
jgi:hypothetical protein